MARIITLQTHREPTSPGKMLRYEFREPLGLTQKQLADALGLDRPTYCEIENGKHSITPQIAIRLERVLRLPATMWLRMQLSLDLYRALHAPDAEAARLLVPIIQAPGAALT